MGRGGAGWGAAASCTAVKLSWSRIRSTLSREPANAHTLWHRSALRRRCMYGLRTATRQMRRRLDGTVNMAVAHSERCDRPVVVSPGKLTAAQRYASRCTTAQGMPRRVAPRLKRRLSAAAECSECRPYRLGTSCRNRKAKQSKAHYSIACGASTAALHKRTARAGGRKPHCGVGTHSLPIEPLCACASTAKACPIGESTAADRSAGRAVLRAGPQRPKLAWMLTGAVPARMWPGSPGADVGRTLWTRFAGMLTSAGTRKHAIIGYGSAARTKNCPKCPQQRCSAEPRLAPHGYPG